MFLPCDCFLLASAVPTHVALRVQVSYNVTDPGQLTLANPKLTKLTQSSDCVLSGICNVTTAVGQKVESTSDSLSTTVPGRAVDGFKLILVIIGSPVDEESPRAGNSVFTVLVTYYSYSYRYYQYSW